MRRGALVAYNQNVGEYTMTAAPQRYVVSDGKLTLLLEYDPEFKGYAVTSPFNPQLITQAHSLEEAFEMAYDALDSLSAAEAVPRRRSAPTGTRPEKKT
jgi:antitoxin HicB